jgi:hypothetical protein
VGIYPSNLPPQAREYNEIVLWCPHINVRRQTALTPSRTNSHQLSYSHSGADAET